MNILGVNADAKTRKGSALGFLTGICYLVPADGFDRMRPSLGDAQREVKRTLCPNASPQCIKLCLFTAGRGVMRPVKEGRMRKTALFFADPVAFVDMAKADVRKLIARAARVNFIPCVRMNGTSDLPWEKLKGSNGLTLLQEFPNVQFYDYTKRPNRNVPANYHLTFSRSECNGEQCIVELQRGRNVAVVFDTLPGDPLPAYFEGVRVIDGDVSDLRFLDPTGVIVGLRAKGEARHATCTGFVVPVESLTTEMEV
jgi:hypothetical protein